MNTDMDIDINTMTDTITCRLVEARTDLGMVLEYNHRHEMLNKLYL